jgi:hypothetical protein
MQKVASASSLPPKENDSFSVSHSLKRKIKDGIVAVSAANTLFIRAWFAMLFDKDFGYFNKQPVAPPALWALLVNITGLSAVIWLLMQARGRDLPRWIIALGLVLFCLLPLSPIDFVRSEYFRIADYQIIAALKRPWVAASVVVCFALLVWQHQRAARFVRMAFALVAPLSIFSIGKMLLILTGVVSLNQGAMESHTPPPMFDISSNQVRVVWIIFDEMDQRLAFDERPLDVNLPEFDRLRAEGLYATNARSAGSHTKVSMPALICGKSVAEATLAGPSELTLKLTEDGTTVDWRSLPSLFSEARKMSLNTALVGWYHPYARVLGKDLNYCEWYPFFGFEPTRASTFTRSLERQISSLAYFFHGRRDYATLCRESLANSLEVVTNAQYSVILLHLPPPHKPGVYLPHEDRFTCLGMPKTKGYFNNLELADRELGRIRSAMEHAGVADRTWILVSADHWWRESKVYDDREDHRVPFLLKPPDAEGARSFPGMFNTVLTHDLILSLLKSDVTNLDEAARWLNERLISTPPLYGRSDLE